MTLHRPFLPTYSKQLKDLSDQDIGELVWETSVELRLGLFTKSFITERNDPNNIGSSSLVRHLLSKIQIDKTTKCLDFGASNAVMATLLAKRGAFVVVQESTPEYHAPVNLVKEANNVYFDYINKSFFDLKIELENKKFDLVLFDGLINQLVNPIIELAIARSFLKEGGLLLIETSSFIQNKNTYTSLHLTPDHKIFLPDLKFLEHLCRILYLKPIDSIRIGNTEGIFKIAFICRAMPHQVINLKNKKNLWDGYNIWSRLDFTKINGKTLIDKNLLAERTIDLSEIPRYNIHTAKTLAHEDEEYSGGKTRHELGINLTNTTLQQPCATTFIKPREQLRLKDIY